MTKNPFKDYKAEESALVLEQMLTPQEEVVIRCQLEGRGSDIVHMLSMALTADAKEGGVLRQILTDALAIGTEVDASEMKIRMHRIGKKQTVN